LSSSGGRDRLLVASVDQDHALARERHERNLGRGARPPRRSGPPSWGRLAPRRPTQPALSRILAKRMSWSPGSSAATLAKQRRLLGAADRQRRARRHGPCGSARARRGRADGAVGDGACRDSCGGRAPASSGIVSSHEQIRMSRPFAGHGFRLTGPACDYVYKYSKAKSQIRGAPMPHRKGPSACRHSRRRSTCRRHFGW